MHQSEPRLAAGLQQDGTFMPQLDGLRAIAVLLVLNHHFLHPQLLFTLRPLVNRLGPLGVRLFFVLSGFLITGILLRCRFDAGTKTRTLSFSLRQFYVRRFLRIFPLYYFVLLLAAIFAFESVRNSLPWHIAYLSNVYSVVNNTWGDGPTSHFWSLSVEEQFYLAWPLFILTVPRRALLPTILLLFASSPIFRLVGYVLGWREVALFYLPIGCLDSLAAGALLAYFASPVFGNIAVRRRIQTVGLLIGLPSTVLCLLLLNTAIATWWVPSALLDTSAALLWVWVVGRASDGFSGHIGTLLGTGPLAYVGRISYGVYIYHFFVFWIIATQVRLPSSHPYLFTYALSMAVTLLVATVSFYAFERPINSLKRFFPYAAPSPAHSPEHATPACADPALEPVEA